jgi:mannose-1-phosphate guanylyltransferase
MPKPAIDPSIAQYYAEKSAKKEDRLMKALTADHVRRIKQIFASHIAGAATLTDKSRITELKLILGKVVTAIKDEHFEDGE